MGINLVEGIFYKKNMLLVSFKDEMQIEGQCGISNLNNYLLKTCSKEYTLNNGFNANIEGVGKDYVLISLNNTLNIECKLDIGYINKNRIRFVKSVDEKVHDICINNYIFKELESIDINNSYGSINSQNTITIEYKGNNRFGKIFKYDFYIDMGDEFSYPIDYYLDDKGTLFLVFEDGMFYMKQEDIVLNVVQDPESVDIIGEKILQGKTLILRNNIELNIDDCNKENMSLVNNIFYKDNVILINFKEDMQINGQYGIRNLKNYLLRINGRQISLDKIATSTPFLIEKRRIVFYLSENLEAPDELSIGYIDKNKVRLIKSESGKIHSICIKNNYINKIDKFNIANSYGYIEENGSIFIEHQGINSIKKIDIQDFYVDIEGERYFALGYSISENEKLKLLFKKDIFIGKDKTIELKVVEYPKSIDIFNNTILGGKELQLYNKIKTQIYSISMVSSRDGEVNLKVLFTRTLLRFKKDDFNILIGDISIPIIKSFKVFKQVDDKRIDEVESVLLTFRVPSSAIYSIFKKQSIRLATTIKYDDIETIDVNNNRVCDQEGKYSEIFKADKLDIILNNRTIKGAEFKVKFNKNVNKRNFQPLKDDVYIIRAGEILFKKGFYEDYIIFNKESRLGKFKLKKKKSTNFINEDSVNSKEVKVIIEKDIIFIRFDENEDLEGITIQGVFTAVNRVMYKPNFDLLSEEDLFVYNWSPWYIFNWPKVTYIPPLTEIIRHPFVGGELYDDYIIELSKENKDRIYGVDNVTKIYGNVSIIGEVKCTEEILLKNIEIYGELIISAIGGSLKISGGRYKNIKVISKL